MERRRRNEQVCAGGQVTQTCLVWVRVTSTRSISPFLEDRVEVSSSHAGTKIYLILKHQTTLSGTMDGSYATCEVKTNNQTAKPGFKWEKQLIRGTVRTMCARTGAGEPVGSDSNRRRVDNAATITAHHQRGWTPTPVQPFSSEGLCLEAKSGRKEK